MIEIEKKFLLSEKDMARLTDGADFLGEFIFTDTYYDNAQYSLTKNDIWLRCRNDRWELKIPKHADGGFNIRQYQEVEGEENLRQIFDVVEKSDFLKDIGEFGYESFCVCETTRRKFKKEEFIIDLDSVRFDPTDASADFDFAIGEIKLLVENEDEMFDARKAIEIFAKKNGLKDDSVLGKVIEYLKRKKPDHYNVLIEAGVVEIGLIPTT